MSNTHRHAPAKRPSPVLLVLSWVGSLLSIGLLFVFGNAVISDFASFRSCNSNSAGISVAACGKQSLNVGDLMLLLLFALAAALVVTLFTAAWRLSRRSLK